MRVTITYNEGVSGGAFVRITHPDGRVYEDRAPAARLVTYVVRCGKAWLRAGKPSRRLDEAASTR